MARFDFDKALRRKVEHHRKLVERRNRRLKDGNGVYDRWAHPVLTGAHTPLFWRYDLDRRDATRSWWSGWASTASSTSGAIELERQDLPRWRASRAPIARASSPWPRARTASTTSASGTTRS